MLNNNKSVSKIRGRGVKLLNHSKNFKNKNFAFSLIELSIILIIIGLLVAGIAAGKSLVDSARARVFIGELNSWKQAVHMFYAMKGRLPGDIQNMGILGYMSPNSYTSSDYQAGTFKASYD